MIVDNVKTCITQNQPPVILTRFKEHAKMLYDMLKDEVNHVFLLYVGNSDKENVDIQIYIYVRGKCMLLDGSNS